MVWQDIVIMILNLVFTYSIGNQVIYGFKKKKGYLTITTALLQGLALVIMGATYLTLDLIFSAIVTAFNGFLWLTLLIQRIIYKKV